MYWIYRLQQRIAITRSECNLLLCLGLLVGVGLGVRYVQGQPIPVPETTYAATDHLFRTASSATNESHTEMLPTPAVAPPDTQRTASAKPTVAPPRSPAPAAATPRMNLNKASSSQLQRLPRIGPKIAARIIEHRTTHGPFQRVQDLVQVKGIGEKTLARLEPLLFVENDS